MYVYNNDDNIFQPGDKVWIANTLLHTETPFEVHLIKVLPADETFGLGMHYVLYVPTSIEDRLEIREANRVFRSRDQFETICKQVKDQRYAYFQKLREAKNRFDGLFNGRCGSMQ
jgi:hypothetical protein